jgi:hypothetical protein
MVLTRLRMSERQIMALIMIACFVAFAGAFFYVGMRRKTQTPDFPQQPVVRWMPQSTASSESKIEYVLADLLDPSLMTLPSMHGFSQPLWQREAPATRPVLEADTQPMFLGLHTETNFSSLLDQASLVDVLKTSVEKSPAVSEEPAGIEEDELPKQLDHSALDALGPLEGRLIISGPDLQIITSDTPLPPTRVRIAVAADGTVRYAVLDRSCGTDSVDARALSLAGRIRFEPDKGSDPMALTWGVVRFLWATAPPPAQTNQTDVTQP